MKPKVQRTKGMKDIFEDAEFYLKFRDLFTEFAIENGFRYIETPVVENALLYTLGLGRTSDVVTKEMFYLKTKEDKGEFVLRPEGTAGVIRAYFENNMVNLPQPVSLFYFERMYRKEKPQLGRLREHYQAGLEILNTTDPFSDFFIIYLITQFLKRIKIETVVKINSIGCHKCRPKYIKKLVKYYSRYRNKVCADCQRRLKENPLRLLDCKVSEDQEYKENAPNILDSLCKFCEEHFQKVLEFLDNRQVPYELDKTLVRGFDYYQRTVFEFFVPEFDLALGGGGRYDLGEIISNSPLPSVGAALGVERIKIILEKKKIDFSYYKKPKVFIAFTSEETRMKALEIYEELQKSKILSVANFFKTSLSSQLDYANKIGVKYSLILGFKELGSESIIFRNMVYGIQEIIKLKNLPATIKKLIKENE